MNKGMNEALEKTLWKQEIGLQDRLLADTPVGSDVSQGQAEGQNNKGGGLVGERGVCVRVWARVSACHTCPSS